MRIAVQINSEVLLERSNNEIYAKIGSTGSIIAIHDLAYIKLINKISNVEILYMSDIEGQYGELASNMAEAALNLHVLLGTGLLQYLLINDGEIVAIARPHTLNPPVPWIKFGVMYSSLPHSFVRISDDLFLLEQPLSKWIVDCRNSVSELLDCIRVLSKPFDLANIKDQINIDVAMIEFLILTNFVGTIESIELLRTWEFHDLGFHFSSRIHDDFRRRGGTYPLKSLEPPSDVYYPPNTLPFNFERKYSTRDNVEKFTDPSFFSVLNNRRSSRKRNSTLTLDALEKIAADSFSVIEVRAAPPYKSHLRPFPSAGGLHELELFCAISEEIAGSDIIVYFNPFGRKFNLILANPEMVRALLLDARDCWQTSDCPRALFIIASRHERVAWKYESMAYRSTMLNAGCALQTIALVVEARGLHGCPIGNGNSEHFSRVVGEAEAVLTSVAEYGLA